MRDMLIALYPSAGQAGLAACLLRDKQRPNPRERGAIARVVKWGISIGLRRPFRDRWQPSALDCPLFIAGPRLMPAS